VPVVRTRAGQQAAALGAAVVAGVGAGVWDDFGIVDEVSCVTDRNEPIKEDALKYERLMAKYKRGCELLGTWAEKEKA